MKKSVHFSSASNVIFFYRSNEISSFSAARESLKRSLMETALLDRSQIKDLKNLIYSWRNREISIVFGNLGRQPFLVNYFLDMCFGSEESVKVMCAWKLSSEYQTQNGKNTDFLIFMEPYFGFTVHKDPSVKHLVILTSHLSFNYWGPLDVQYFHLSNGTKLNPHPPQKPIPFKPPPFHEQAYNDEIPEEVLLDVSDSKTAHEAYLRLLTGLEVIGKRPFKVHITNRDRDILKLNLERSRESFRCFMNKDLESEDKFEVDLDLYNLLNTC